MGPPPRQYPQQTDKEVRTDTGFFHGCVFRGGGRVGYHHDLSLEAPRFPVKFKLQKLDCSYVVILDSLWA